MKGHFEMESPVSSRQNSLTFEPCENYTRGIDVQQVRIQIYYGIRFLTLTCTYCKETLNKECDFSYFVMQIYMNIFI